MSYNDIKATPDFNEYDANDYKNLSTSLIGETARQFTLNTEFLIVLLILLLIIGIITGIYLLSKR